MIRILSAIATLALLLSANAYAESQYLDSQSMSQCGGTVELRRADNDDLALKFTGLNTSRCDTLRFYDADTGRTLKTYEIHGNSFTLSRSQRAALSNDCRVGFNVSGRHAVDHFEVTLGWWCELNHPTDPMPPTMTQAFQLSNSGNCKLMVNGSYSGRNVSGEYCAGASSRNDIVTYEFSHAGNCKRMINGSYSGQNVAEYMCTTSL
jgi:hypothetical protein